MRTDPADIAAGWWRDLQPYFPNGARNPRGDRAALARLRRADLIGAMDDPATFALFRALGCRHARELTAVALCAGVLAVVREDDSRHPARALGPAPGGDERSATMSPLRFRRLVEASEPEERLIALRRAAMLAGRQINVRGIAGACLDWSDATRRFWIFQYYNAGDAAPEADTHAEETT